ncbi:HNH endonuclease [Pseudomonas alliivorans]|uniref:HNH endonuclease n=1 Tax=Pseudomonas alliivorans TaxID=2810613 RepID=UPI00211BDAEF|nr:HNH endonuclease [Pseudomonas alliivorans]MCQ9473413.1 HNH endonuclease [Pseudomonas alliivorans]
MSVEEDFHHQMLDIYQHAGTEVGYWANYFLRGVKKHGGLNYARTALEKRKNDSIQKGFQALVDAGRVDISMESLVVRPEFASLFTEAEIAEARARLGGVAPYTLRVRVPAGEVFPDELPPGLPYTEGAIKQVTVNLYERNAKAREECLSKHGYDCAVCTMNFEKLYGEIGKKFIHVHHKKPLATIREEYELNARKDLVPVCPNCHAMLHTSNPPLSVSELQEKMRAQAALQL